MNVEYYWTKILKKLRGVAMSNSVLDKTSKIESGTQFIKSSMDKHSFCGYDCQIINTKIGSYCSIAGMVVIGGSSHPVDWVSTSPVFYSDKDSINKKYALFEKKKTPHTIIGNDVWIGEKVLIKAGVTIGHGAVIGMGSVVTKDVMPYSIVGGVPAKLIRKRFSDEVIQRLLESKWWDLDDDKLSACAQFIKEPEKFLKELGI